MILPRIYPVTCHTDHVGPGSTFVAIRGKQYDETVFIDEAIKKGACRIILEHSSLYDTSLHSEVEFEYVHDVRAALARYAARAYNSPATKLSIIGITGTKGKTSTTYLVEHILRAYGYKTALMGTIEKRILNKVDTGCSLTTPESDYLQTFLTSCVDEGVTHVVMEVSSNALALHRTDEIAFSVAGFTNLGVDHLDFHENMENYFASKMLLFNHLKKDGVAVINGDCSWGKKALLSLQNRTVSGQLVPIKAENMNVVKNSLENGLVFEYCGHLYSCAALFGFFNLYNMAMAIRICISLGISPAKIASALKSFPGVPGRMEHYRLKSGAQAFVDYAHNAHAMEAVLQTLRSLSNDLIVVFGCGGNKDTSRRASMGLVAATIADQVIICDDNPRFEDRMTIITDIVKGVPENLMHKIFVEPDRAKAIDRAARIATPSSTIALLGKGHETYYTIKGEHLYFSDREQIQRY